MNSKTFGSLIFWEGIHYLTKVNEPSMQNINEWVENIKDPNVDLYIQLFSFSPKESETYDEESNNNSILAAFSYIKDSKHHMFILHTYQPFSFLLFAHPFFSDMKGIIEDSKRSKIVIKKEQESDIKVLFNQYFKININGIQSSFENQKQYDSIFDGENSQISSLLDYFLMKQKKEYTEKFLYSVKNIQIDMNGETCLTNEEKQLFSTVILCLFSISSANRTPQETNRHLIVT